MSTRVDQLLDGYTDGDAISQEARIIRDLLRAEGLDSDIIAPARNIGPRVQHDTLSLHEVDPTSSGTILYHFSTASEATDAYLTWPAHRLLRYHNITPAHYYTGFDDRIAAQLKTARDTLPGVASASEHAWAVSAYNQSELIPLSNTPASVMPLMFKPDTSTTQADPAFLTRYSGPLKNILFVGRIAPNKALEDVLLAFAWLHHSLDVATRLILVGSERHCPRYYALLRMLANQLDLANVCFEGFLSPPQLEACYQRADLFVTASHHEGYCLPLVESMTHQIPVLARHQGGMPEALNDAGVLFDNMPAPVLGSLMHRMLHDEPLRQTILASQTQRVKELTRRDLTADVRTLCSFHPKNSS